MTHALPARQRDTRPEPNSPTRGAARVVRRVLTRLSVATLAFGLVIFGGADAALSALANGADWSKPTTEAPALAQAPPIIWAIDADGDGVTDYYNPTHGAVRADDAFGSGEFGAIRDAGKRQHEGVDYIAAPGAVVHSPISGEVARLGYAYGGEGGYRVVEIVNSETKIKARVFYVAPTVEVGDVVLAGQEIGSAQDLNARYPGITNHVHVELRDAQQRLIDASEQLPSPTVLHAGRAVAGHSAMP